MKKRKGYYSISVVAKMFSVHQQTIRMYEKEGLLTPKRSDGNTRLFSEEDVERLEEIINLTHKMGVNLAGVEIILKLQKKLGKMQQEVNKLFKQMDGDISLQKEAFKADIKQQVSRLAEMKKDSKLVNVGGEERSHIIDNIIFEEEDDESQSIKGKRSAAKKDSRKSQVDTNDDWEIDYDNE
ncbi:MerR family transcriptional regulator [Candidatus Dependentiae bacterium]|nr:MerR family transcriptional regulator [Candidatus Dependentiae bacterium]